jgi:DNA-directed RNA polymerase subunit RPC12/RpoP
MPITVMCTRCSAKLNAPDTAAGKRVKCPKPGCGEVILVPEPATADFEVVDDEPKAVPPTKISVSPQIQNKSQATKKPRDNDENDEDDRPRNRRRIEDEDEEDRPRTKRRGDDDDEEEERPKSKRRRDDDDEEDRPRTKRRKDDEEEEERPRSKRRRDDDDEEEERPRSKRRWEDTDDDDEPDYRPGRCPECGSRRFTKVSWTFWGGIIGPAILGQVRCDKCRTSFSRKSGKPIGAAQIGIYMLVVIGIGAMFGVIGLILQGVK